MDVEAVRSLARQTGTKADEIEHLSSALSSQLDGTQWVGHDAVSFRGQGSGAHRNQLAPWPTPYVRPPRPRTPTPTSRRRPWPESQ
jgi:hypothetical protein